MRQHGRGAASPCHRGPATVLCAATGGDSLRGTAFAVLSAQISKPTRGGVSTGGQIQLIKAGFRGFREHGEGFRYSRDRVKRLVHRLWSAAIIRSESASDELQGHGDGQANPRCYRCTQAHYKWADGTTADVLLADADPLAIVDGLPWRTFPWYLGQRNYAGTYWCATECSDVNYESRLELSRLRQSRLPSSSHHRNPTDSFRWASALAPSSATKTSSARGTGRNPSSSIRRSWSANPS